MHIQHVIDQPENKRIVRYIISCLDALAEHTNSIFIVTEDDDINIPNRFKRYQYILRRCYQTFLDPDCIIFHSVWSNSIYSIDAPCIAIQQECHFLPLFDIKAFAASNVIKRSIPCHGLLYPTSDKQKRDRGEWPVVGLTYEHDVDSSDGSMLSGIGELIQGCRFISPKGSDEYKAALFPISNRVRFVKDIINHIGECDIAIFKGGADSYDYCPDLVLMAIASGCVPVVNTWGAYKELLPNDMTVFDTAHQAVRICWKLMTQKDLYNDVLASFKEHYQSNFAPNIFRTNLLREIEQVVIEHTNGITK